MPRFDNTEVMVIPNSSFQFSAIKPDQLGATEYTLVTIANTPYDDTNGWSVDSTYTFDPIN